MATYTFTLAGRITIDATIEISHGTETVSAWGLAFDGNADVIGETDSARYSGFCDSEVAYDELHRLINGRWGVESEDIAAAIDARMPACQCD